VDVKIDATGIKVDTQSLASVLTGGIAFETPPESAPLSQSAAATEYTLFNNRADALKNPESDKLEFVMLFDESVHGLEPGAPVDFRGIAVGEVAAIKLEMSSSHEIVVAVETNIYPSRLRSRAVKAYGVKNAAQRRELISTLVGAGMRAQLRPSSLLTGQLYVALDFFPASNGKVNWATNPPQLPTQKGSLVELQAAIGSIAANIDKLPLAQMSDDARQTLQSATRLIRNVDADLVPEVRTSVVELRKTLTAANRLLSSDAPLQTDTRDAMREIARSARAFRLLSEYLERHPEALLMGKKEEGGR
jgi:paraquat-inducible protein B